MTREQKPVVWPTLLRWPTNSRRRNGNLSNLVSIQMEILAGSGLPPPLRVQKPTGNCLDEFRCQKKPATPPADIHRHSHEDSSFRCCQSLKDCVLKGGVRGGNEQINRTHSEFRRPQLFHLYLPEKMVIYLLHMSAWTLNVHCETRT